MKITVVGAGTAGCFTALQCAWTARCENSIEVELRYDPQIPAEPVGQGTNLDAPHLLTGALDFNWYNNKIHATPKSGILYENWGKSNDKVFHPFFSDLMAMHYCPKEVQNLILKSNKFKVIEQDVSSLDDIDSDYIFDCRGKPENFEDYDTLINPINAVVLGKPKWNVSESLWSRHVATPDGWTFVIPNAESSPSHDYCVGYCYNKNITSREEAENNFTTMFDVDIKKHLEFSNYVAKNPVIDDRVILSGNRLFFLEPLESTATQAFQQWAQMALNTIVYKKFTLNEAAEQIREYIQHLQNFVLWHYKFGSKYNTPFWEYASSLVSSDPLFERFVEGASYYGYDDVKPQNYGGRTPSDLGYAQWNLYSFRNWYDGMTKAS